MFFIALVTIILLIVVLILLSRVSTLNFQMHSVLERLDRLEGKPAAHTLPTESPASAAPVPPSLPSAPVAPPKAAPKASRTREEWEALIGGKVLNRIGAVALIIAVGLFLKYAFDQRLISETVRVLIGGLAGIVALIGAARTRRKGFEIFAQGLVGAGIAILYLSVYSSFNFYHLIPQWAAFVLMAVVTAVTLGHGVYYNSLAVSLLGWAGGFLTPVMLSTGHSNEIGLFSYVALLNVGLLGIMLMRNRWWVLEPLTFGGTWILFTAWYVEYYVAGDLALTVFFVMLFWAMFFGIDVLRLSREFQPSRIGSFVGSANALAAFLALYSMIDADYHGWMGLVTLVLGAIYLLTFLSARKRREIDLRLEMQYVLVALALVVAALGIQFSKFETPVAWSLLAGVVGWASRRWKRPYAYYCAAIILGIGFLKFLGEQDQAQWAVADQIHLLFNMRSLALVSLFAGSIVNALFVAGGEGKAADTVRSILYYGAALAALMLIALELNDFFRQRIVGLTGEDLQRVVYVHIHTFAVAMALYTVPVLWVGVRRSIHPFVVAGASVLLMAALLAVARGFLFIPIESYRMVLNVRVIGLLIMAVTGAWQVRMLAFVKGQYRWASGAQVVMRMLVVLVLFTLLTGETIDFFGQRIQSSFADLQDTERLENLRQLSLSGIWVLYSAGLMIFGIAKKVRALRIAAFVLFGVSILKIFIYDLSFLDTLYRIFSFIALGIVLLAVSYAYQRYRDVIFGTEMVPQAVEAAASESHTEINP